MLHRMRGGGRPRQGGGCTRPGGGCGVDLLDITEEQVGRLRAVGMEAGIRIVTRAAGRARAPEIAIANSRGRS